MRVPIALVIALMTAGGVPMAPASPQPFTPIEFAWQAGYGVFAVSFSHLEKVTEYIARQEEHHRVRGFQDELRAMLAKHRIEWDEKYLWD